MSHEEALIALESIVNNNNDPEADHEEADTILCEFLSELGYDDIVNLFQQINKWYA